MPFVATPAQNTPVSSSSLQITRLDFPEFSIARVNLPPMEPISDTIVRLNDGRGIGLAEFGDPAGLPVFYFHGFPSCRLEPAISHEDAAAAGIRILAIDRPGIGRSDPAPRGNVARTVNDVTACADSLGVARFAVLGGS